MARIGLVGPTYKLQSLNAECQRCVNWYPEKIESDQGKGPIALEPTPGLELFAALGGKSLRGQLGINGREWAVADTNLFEVFADGTSVQRNAALPLANDGLPVSFASLNPTTANPGQVLIASGGGVYVLDLSTNLVTQVDPTTFNNGYVQQVAYCDGFFIATLRNSNIWFVSGALNATLWPNFSGISVFPENIVSMCVDHRELWLFGTNRTVVYYASGNPFFPFDVLGGGYNETGSCAPFATTRLDNSLMWIGGDERGQGMAWKAEGYRAVRVSDHSVETAWQKFPRLDDAVGYAYQENGHVQWVINFPSADQTWVFDTATGMWHERTFTDATTAPPTEHAHRSWNHQFIFGKHLVGDPKSGNLYRMSGDLVTDFGNPLRRLRRAPHISTEQQRIFHGELQIDLEVGSGPQFQGDAQATFFNLADPTGAVWQVGMNDQGQLVTTPLAGGSAITKIMLDVTGTYCFRIAVSAVGVLSLVAAIAGSSNEMTLPMVSTSGKTQSTLMITAVSPTIGQFTVSQPVIVGRGPLLQMRYSNDSARTWLEREALDCGQPGEYLKRVIWRRLGSARDRVYEISTSDPWSPRIVDAYLTASPGFSPMERITAEAKKRA